MSFILKNKKLISSKGIEHNNQLLNEVLENKVDKAEMKKEEIAITDIAGLDYSRFKLIKIGNTITANGWITTTKEVSSSSDLFKIPYSNPYANPSRLIVLNADGTFKGSIEYGSKKNIFSTRNDLVKNKGYLVIGTIII